MTPVGQRIEDACEAIGISRSTLAQRVGISKQYIYHIGTGRIRQSKHFVAIATALNVPIEWLMTGQGPVPAWASPNITDRLIHQNLFNRSESLSDDDLNRKCLPIVDSILHPGIQPVSDDQWRILAEKLRAELEQAREANAMLAEQLAAERRIRIKTERDLDRAHSASKKSRGRDGV